MPVLNLLELNAWRASVAPGDVVKGPHGLDLVERVNPDGLAFLRHGQVVGLSTLRPATDALADLPSLAWHHDPAPVVEVKDRNLWAHDRTMRCVTDADDDVGSVADVLAELEAASVEVEGIYQDAVRMFWDHFAPEAALEAGFPGEVYSAGRMGGYAMPDVRRHDWTEYVEDRATLAITVDDDYSREAARARDRFLLFVQAMGEAKDQAMHHYTTALANAMADLTARREACIIRGEN